MISAKLSNKDRKAIYRRDNFRCALCDSDRGLQLHHVVSRGQGGTDYPQNLITLCWRCHAVAHGTRLPEYDHLQPAEIAQACVEYVADLYTDMGYIWNPWGKCGVRLRRRRLTGKRHGDSSFSSQPMEIFAEM